MQQSISHDGPYMGEQPSGDAKNQLGNRIKIYGSARHLSPELRQSKRIERRDQERMAVASEIAQIRQEGFSLPDDSRASFVAGD